MKRETKENNFKKMEKLGQSPLEQNISRRDFLTLMGAAAIMTSVKCKVPKEVISPLPSRPPELIPGKSLWYASICGGCKASCGMLVKTNDGKPVKIEGNDANLLSQGGLCPRGQASLYDLYDPERLRTPYQNDKKISWDRAITDIRQIIRKSRYPVMLTSPDFSLSEREIIRSFSRKNRLKLAIFDLFNRDRIIFKSQKISWGKDSETPRVRLGRADVIVSVDNDFLGTDENCVVHSKEFSKRRNPDNRESFNQLHVFESMMTVTGMNADFRTAIRPGDQLCVLFTIAHELEKMGLSAPIELPGFTTENKKSKTGKKKEIILNAAKALFRSRRKTAVLADNHFGKNSTAVAVAADMLNGMLRSDGFIIDYENHLEPANWHLGYNFDDFTADLKKGRIDFLLVDGVNPLYSFHSKEYKGLFKKIKTIASITDCKNETSDYAHYILPRTHFLEQWTDKMYSPGYYGLGQPVIRPLWNAKSLGDILIAISGGKLDGSKSFYQFIQKNWQSNIIQLKSFKTSKGKNSDFNSVWNGLLQTGFFTDNFESWHKRNPPRKFKGDKYLKDFAEYKREKGLRLTIYNDNLMRDGRYANNPLVYEVPDPVTKTAWGNFAAVSLRLAKKMGIKTGDMLKLKTGGGNGLELPALLQPGLHKDTVAVAVGYGRESVGPIGKSIGGNVFLLTGITDNPSRLSGTSVEITKTGKIKKAILAQVQFLEKAAQEEKIGALAKKRNIIASGTLAAFTAGKILLPDSRQESGDRKKHIPKKFSSMPPAGDWIYDGPFKWGMCIDLTKCTGCSACVASCYLENNIPIVGPEEVALGREMSWIRMDRYFIGDDNDLEIVNQPVLCQQCDNAPCENVCPVFATTHSEDGLNEMTYNRCIGTRYCANNCPYKVRRFNWREYWKDKFKSPLQFLLNPSVTVRERGIMEKCTFCVQRIQEAKYSSKERGLFKKGKRHIEDGALRTACQQSCPSDAITFGNLNDPGSKIAEIFKIELNNAKNSPKRGYRLLENLGTSPAIIYLAKIRNRRMYKG
jgi:molybdopterin-containing oxidoreductase family iron-sulfur binding subunit